MNTAHIEEGQQEPEEIDNQRKKKQTGAGSN
jgi:hypothetical protein